MKNNISLKKYLLLISCVTILSLSIFYYLLISQYQTYTKNYNIVLNNIIEKVDDKYPNVTRNEIIDILNSKDLKDNSFLSDYGIDIDTNSLVLENDLLKKQYLWIEIIFFLTIILVIVTIFLMYDYFKNKKIKDITKLIDQINHKNYSLDFSDNEENALSVLQNEIYKTTIMLKEQAENEKKDKGDLKNSLEDISHQLKTPLTSINIMLDNLIDNPDMDNETKIAFITKIKREINNINFLVISLLKLSKFDANVVSFKEEEINLNKVIEESIRKVSILCDLKNIKINVHSPKEIKVIGDFLWQVEAITNILKNAVEHSQDNSSVDIFIEDNKAYTKLVIRDYGEGIDFEDQRHLFERFYKGKNASSNSFGIGLALAKSIIEKDNGIIKVESIPEKTSFIIKYFKK